MRAMTDDGDGRDLVLFGTGAMAEVAAALARSEGPAP